MDKWISVLFSGFVLTNGVLFLSWLPGWQSDIVTLPATKRTRLLVCIGFSIMSDDSSSSESSDSSPPVAPKHPTLAASLNGEDSEELDEESSLEESVGSLEDGSEGYMDNEESLEDEESMDEEESLEEEEYLEEDDYLDEKTFLQREAYLFKEAFVEEKTYLKGKVFQRHRKKGEYLQGRVSREASGRGRVSAGKGSREASGRDCLECLQPSPYLESVRETSTV